MVSADGDVRDPRRPSGLKAGEERRCIAIIRHFPLTAYEINGVPLCVLLLIGRPKSINQIRNDWR